MNLMKKLYLIISMMIFVITLSGCTQSDVSYTIAFQSNGGEAIDSLDVVEGQTINLPIPTREGHTFTGWFTGNGPNDIQFSNITPVIQDLTLYARWQINQYSITFDTDGGTLIANLTQDYDSIINVSDPIKEGHTFVGWSPDLPDRMPAENIAISAQWEVNQYTITFDSDGGSAISPITADFDSNLNVEEPVKEGHTFIGWSPELPDRMPAENISVAAQWEVNQYVVSVRYPGENYEDQEMNISASLSAYNSSVITSNGRLLIWGSNRFGVLGDGTNNNSSVPIDITRQFDLDLGEIIAQVSLGVYHGIALTSENRVFIWGSNNFSQLGLTENKEVLTPVEITKLIHLNTDEHVTKVLAGTAHTVVLTSKGRVFTWGSNLAGQLGNGTLNDSDSPLDITPKFDLIADEKIKTLSSFSSYNIALTSENRLFSWGWNTFGQLGNGNFDNQSIPVDITSNFNLNENELFVKVVVGNSHSGVITSQNRVFTWGSNSFGELGNDSMKDQSFPVDITDKFDLDYGTEIVDMVYGSKFSLALTSNNEVFFWGHLDSQHNWVWSDYNKQPVNIPAALRENEDIKSIHAGSKHYLILTSNNRLLLKGNNNSGELGVGNYDPVFVETHVDLNIELEFLSLSQFHFDFDTFIDLSLPNRQNFDMHLFESRTRRYDQHRTHEFFYNRLFEIETMPAQNLTLYGRWIPSE